jgi:hypothetical protein
MKKTSATDCLKNFIEEAFNSRKKITIIFASYSIRWIEIKRYINCLCKKLSARYVILRSYINKPYGIRIIPA